MNNYLIIENKVESRKPPSNVNEAWHRANQMPPNATLDQRIEWHLEHHKNCCCREIPERLYLEMKKRGIQVEKCMRHKAIKPAG